MKYDDSQAIFAIYILNLTPRINFIVTKNKIKKTSTIYPHASIVTCLQFTSPMYSKVLILQ